MSIEDIHPQVESVAAEISSMGTRGAAPIARVAAAALETQAEESSAGDPPAFRRGIRTAARRLLDTQPTAVGLPSALRYVLERAERRTVEEFRANTAAGATDTVVRDFLPLCRHRWLVLEAETPICATLLENNHARPYEFRDRFETAREDLGAIGANRLQDGDTVLTHCHATDALACVEAAADQGKSLSVLVRETRPRKRGQVTARQLRELGVPVTRIADGAAGWYLDDAGHVFVGADAIVTERGQFPPAGIVALMRELVGEGPNPPWEEP